MIMSNLEIKLKGGTKILDTNVCKIKKWSKSYEAYVLFGEAGRVTEINLDFRKIFTLKFKE